MKSKYALTSLTSLVAVYFALQSNASADDCHDLLIHDTHSTQKDITTRLSYYSEITKDNFEQRKKNIDTAGDYLGIISGSADYGEFNEKRDHQFWKYGFSYDQQDLSSYYESTLPIERVRAYAECQHRFGFLAHVQHVSEDILDIQIEWDKGLNMPETVEFKPSFLDGGEIRGDAPKQLKHGEQFTIAFKRDEGKDFHLNVNVGGTTARVFVPRFIKEPPPASPTPTPDLKRLSELVKTGHNTKFGHYVGPHKYVGDIGNAQKYLTECAEFLHKFNHPAAGQVKVWADQGDIRVLADAINCTVDKILEPLAKDGERIGQPQCDNDHQKNDKPN